MQINEDTLRAEVSVALPMSAPKLLFVEMVERLLRQTMVKQVPGGHHNALCSTDRLSARSILADDSSTLFKGVHSLSRQAEPGNPGAQVMCHRPCLGRPKEGPVQCCTRQTVANSFAQHVTGGLLSAADYGEAGPGGHRIGVHLLFVRLLVCTV